MEAQLNQIIQKAKAEIQSAADLHALGQIKANYLGKKSELTDLLKAISQLPKEERPKMGQLVNQSKRELAQVIAEKQTELEAQALQAQLSSEQVDVTLPGTGLGSGQLHPVTRVQQRIEEIFTAAGFELAQGPEIENEHYNFEALNVPPHHPAREMQDTFYLPGEYLLRTHTSSVQIRSMEGGKPPFRLIASGRVYRCDSDRTHSPMFHQMEGLVIDKGVTFADLKGLLQQFFNAFFESEVNIRLRPSYFPFTEPSAEVDIQSDLLPGENWMEVLGCGMVHPNVLRSVGIDPDEYSGFAFGLGLDRMAMLRYGVTDLRLLFENDLRVLQQF